METDVKYALPNMFSVGTLMTKIDMDMIFSCSEILPELSDEFLLLNNNMAGQFDKSTIQNFIDTGSRVVIISNKGMKMYAYNIDEDEMTSAMIEMTM